MLGLKINVLIKLYVIALPIFLCIDMLWLGLLAKNFYANQIGFLMAKNINWLAAIIFYLLFVFGLVVFVIYPAAVNNSFNQALLLGAFFGLVTYATYDLTSLAVIKDWPLMVTLVDLAWGSFLACATSVITYLIYSRVM